MFGYTWLIKAATRRLCDLWLNPCLPFAMTASSNAAYIGGRRLSRQIILTRQYQLNRRRYYKRSCVGHRLLMHVVQHGLWLLYKFVVVMTVAMLPFIKFVRRVKAQISVISKFQYLFLLIRCLYLHLSVSHLQEAVGGSLTSDLQHHHLVTAMPPSKIMLSSKFQYLFLLIKYLYAYIYISQCHICRKLLVAAWLLIYSIIT
jgi:hypothetical protein